jgi:hypothetical protein
MEDVTYLKINLYLRMLHPLTTTGVIPILILVVLNMRITKGIKELQVSFSLKIELFQIKVKNISMSKFSHIFFSSLENDTKL